MEVYPKNKRSISWGLRKLCQLQPMTTATATATVNVLDLMDITKHHFGGDGIYQFWTVYDLNDDHFLQNWPSVSPDIHCEGLRILDLSFSKALRREGLAVRPFLAVKSLGSRKKTDVPVDHGLLVADLGWKTMYNHVLSLYWFFDVLWKLVSVWSLLELRLILDHPLTITLSPVIWHHLPISSLFELSNKVQCLENKS